MTPLQSGQLIDGQYKLLHLLGEGGMGQVFLAEQVSMQREVVIKFLHQRTADVERATIRFHREAQLLSSIEHPHVVTVFAFGVTDAGQAYLVMERVRGHTLAAILTAEGPLSPARVLLLADQILSALIEAHANDVIHRDLKPENIMVTHTADGVERVKILDFGVAKLLDDNEDSAPTGLTHTGAVIGTPRYMSPEQINDDPLDGRSDLYALGIILYEALTGEHPIDADKPIQFLVQHILQTPRPLHEMAPTLAHVEALDALIMPALAKDPAARFADASVMRQHLREVMAAVEPDPATAWPDPHSGVNTPRIQRPSQGSGIFVRVTTSGDANTWAEVSPPASTQEPLSIPLTADPAPVSVTAERDASSPSWHTLIAAQPWIPMVIITAALASILGGLLVWALVGGDQDQDTATVPQATDEAPQSKPAAAPSMNSPPEDPPDPVAAPSRMHTGMLGNRELELVHEVPATIVIDLFDDRVVVRHDTFRVHHDSATIEGVAKFITRGNFFCLIVISQMSWVSFSTRVGPTMNQAVPYQSP